MTKKLKSNNDTLYMGTLFQNIKEVVTWRHNIKYL